MEQRVSLITLGVEDLARARSFYEKLGWRALDGPQSVVFFQCPGMILALWSREELAKDAGVSVRGRGDKECFGGVALAYNARVRDEVDAVLKEAQKAGAELLKPAADTFWGGYSGYFRDPDCHVWEVAFNPHWTIAADGGVRAG